MTRSSAKLHIVRDEEPRWTERTPPQGLPFRPTRKDPSDHVICNPALVAWLERKEVA